MNLFLYFLTRQKLINRLSFFLLFCILNSLNELSAQQQQNLTAYIVLHTECPISQQLVPAINNLVKKYSHVKFISVFTAWDKHQQIIQFKLKYGLRTVFIHDRKHRLISFLSASVTPEAFLIDSHKHILYKGAINDQFVNLGERKGTAVIDYLGKAINEYQLFKTVKLPNVHAVGCKIEPLKP